MVASSWYVEGFAKPDIVRRLVRLARDVINPSLSEEQISDETNFFELGLGSLNVVELLSAIEEAFDVVIEGDELSAELFMRFGNLVALVERKIREGR